MRMVAWVAQCWFGLSGGRRLTFVGLLRTKSASGFDQFEMSLIQSSPDVSEINHMALPMLSSSMFPLMAAEPKGRRKMFGNLTNLYFFQWVAVGWEEGLEFRIVSFGEIGSFGEGP